MSNISNEEPKDSFLGAMYVIANSYGCKAVGIYIGYKVICHKLEKDYLPSNLFLTA